MARAYAVSAQNVTVTATANFAQVFVNPGTTCSLEFLRGWMSQNGSTTSAMETVALQTQVTAFPTLTATTPAKLNLLDPVSQIVSGTAGAAGTSGTNATVAGGGAKTAIYSDNFNVLNGWLWVPTPMETIVMNAGASSGFGLYTPTAAVSTAGWSFGLTYQER
jgi:hypothetical protein